MKNRFELWQVALDELGARCSVSTAGDINTVVSRMKHEGDAFFDITLPKFGKDFERALAYSAVVEGQFVGWKKRMPQDGLFHAMLVTAENPGTTRALPMRDAVPDLFTQVERERHPSRGWDDIAQKFSDEHVTSKLPEFLGGFLELVFHVESGRLIHVDLDQVNLDDPLSEATAAFHRTVEAVHAIRQLTPLFGKVEPQCSEARNKAGLEQYAE